MPHIPTMPVCTTAASDPFTPVVSSNAFLVRKMLRWCPTTIILVTTSLNELELHLGRDYDWTSVNLTRALTSANQIKTKTDKLEVSLRLNARFSKLRLRAGSAGEYAAWVKRFQAIATNSMDKTTEKKASHERVPSKASTSSPVSELSMTPSSFASSVSEPMSPTSVAYETEEEFDEELTTVSAADKMYDLPVEMMHTSMSHSFSSARVVGMSGDSMLMEKLVVSERWSWSPRASHCSVETSVVHTRTSIPWVG
ncbi:hypothetical protein Poli38472_010188 [Pythium oligandrum]|uniref:Uncharacterized protein n=1 Tax=Pythium oligandrum TaxID=41045 RepID=A0A8K1C8H2_PYTOL|nr:hypothetical protein Poli38472_010188 [Pythium oligandrum]|eukprot:TMW58629.1 hypothetical protein Poli38472_010188 [Pythium oligandrum]